jgi:ribosomal protein S18 acetylase RimI-like enzyme
VNDTKTVLKDAGRHVSLRPTRTSENLSFSLLAFNCFRNSQGGNYLIFSCPRIIIPLMILVYFLWLEITLVRGRRYFVTVNGEVGGVFAFTKKSGIFFIEVLAIAPRHRRHRIASAILCAAAASATKASEELELSVFKGNIPAQRLYNVNGFTREKMEWMSIILRHKHETLL